MHSFRWIHLHRFIHLLHIHLEWLHLEQTFASNSYASRADFRIGLISSRHLDANISAGANISVQTSRCKQLGTNNSVQISRYKYLGTNISVRTFLVQTSQCKHPSANISVQISRCKYLGANISMQTSRCKHPGANISVQTSRCKHLGANISVQTSRCRHLGAGISVQISLFVKNCLFVVDTYLRSYIWASFATWALQRLITVEVMERGRGEIGDGGAECRNDERREQDKRSLFRGKLSCDVSTRSWLWNQQRTWCAEPQFPRTLSIWDSFDLRLSKLWRSQLVLYTCMIRSDV
jgi:hypothetical protein